MTYMTSWDDLDTSWDDLDTKFGSSSADQLEEQQLNLYQFQHVSCSLEFKATVIDNVIKSDSIGFTDVTYMTSWT
jgi:hypothetical protein